jgi:hypothetical protein
MHSLLQRENDAGFKLKKTPGKAGGDLTLRDAVTAADAYGADWQ